MLVFRVQVVASSVRCACNFRRESGEKDIETLFLSSRSMIRSTVLPCLVSAPRMDAHASFSIANLLSHSDLSVSE